MTYEEFAKEKGLVPGKFYLRNRGSNLWDVVLASDTTQLTLVSKMDDPEFQMYTLADFNYDYSWHIHNEYYPIPTPDWYEMEAFILNSNLAKKIIEENS